MLNKSLSYKAILRIAGLFLIFYGLYRIFGVFTAHVEAYSSGGLEYSGPMIFWAPGEALTYILYGRWSIVGPLLFVSLGLFCLALPTMRARVAYWSLQVLLWFASMSFWFPAAAFLTPLSRTNGINVPESFTPFFLGALVLSAILFALYKPVTHVLRKLLGGAVTTPALVHLEGEMRQKSEE